MQTVLCWPQVRPAHYCVWSAGSKKGSEWGRYACMVPDYWSWRNSDIQWEQSCILWAAVTPKAGSTSILPAVLSLTKMTDDIESLQIKSSTIHPYPAHFSDQIMASASHFHTQHLFSQREQRALTEVANTPWLLEGVFLNFLSQYKRTSFNLQVVVICLYDASCWPQGKGHRYYQWQHPSRASSLSIFPPSFLPSTEGQTSSLLQGGETANISSFH